eukprot:4742490-Prymnesium_polylepis.1
MRPLGYIGSDAAATSTSTGVCEAAVEKHVVQKCEACDRSASADDPTASSEFAREHEQSQRPSGMAENVIGIVQEVLHK